MDKEELRKAILEQLREKKAIKVEELMKTLKVEEKALVEILLDLENREEIQIIEPIPTRISLSKYLFDINSAFWFHFVNLAILIAITITFIPDLFIPYILKSAISIAFIIFFPGFATVQFLFPNREISLAEKLAISIGISIALAPVFGLLLYYTLKLGILQVMLMISAFTFIMNVIALNRKYKTGKEWARILHL